MDPNEEFSTFYICIDMVLFPLLHSYKNLASNIDISILRYFRPQFCVDTEWFRCSLFPSLKYSEAFDLWITFTHSCTLYSTCLNLHNHCCLGFDSGRKYYLSAGLTMKDIIIWGWGAWLYLRLKYWLDFEKQFYLRLRC